jgi:Xaa-Pro aminopeptidase
MLDRRQFITSVGLSALASQATTAKTGNGIGISGTTGAEVVQGGCLLNLQRAYQVMDEENLDALIVTRPINFYHFTGYYDHLAVRMDSPGSFAILSRDEKRPSSVVMNQFIYYYSVADSNFKWDSTVNLFTGWGDKIATAESRDQTEARREVLAPFVFSSKNTLLDRDFEKARTNALNMALDGNPPSGNANSALIRAMEHLGLTDSRIGIDDPVIDRIIKSANLKSTAIDGDYALRRIRMVKSQQEIELMKIAATTNAEAALAAASALRSGATLNELRATFFAQCALRGNMPLFLQVDTIMSEVFNMEFKEGSAFAIDAVSQGFHYTGDYGRTVFIGEPTKSMKRATDAIAIGWDAVRENLKPGIRYSEIKAIGRRAIKSAGYDLAVAVTPHSVGLCHTDEPGRDGPGAYWQKDDLVLEENMIISVDMPVLHTGIGGSAHLEDLTLITKDGSEQINSIGDRVIIV